MNVRRLTCDHPFVLELLEREDQLDSLHRLFDQAEAGSGHLVFLGAEAGAGKTALVQAFGDSVASRARVLTGWCDPLSAPRPAGPLIDMAHGLSDPVRAILGAEGRAGLFDAMLSDLTTYLRPTVLVFEDVHWADETTLDLLRFLGRRASASRALLIATYRDDEVGPDHPLRTRLGDLATQATVTRLNLSPLSEAAVTTLAAGTTMDPSAIWTRTAGNAFYVTELLQAAGDDVPATVADAVVARVARLSAPARHALTMTAVIGSRVLPSALFHVPGVDALAIDECVTAGLLRLAPPVFTFRHELVRQAVLSTLGEVQRRQLNDQVLGALLGRTPDPDDLARLAELAENAANAAAVLELAPAAARRAASLGSHREAAGQYERALRFIQDPAGRVDLLELLSVEHYVTGALVPATKWRREALAIRRGLDQPHRVGDNLRWLARLYWYAGRRVDGERCAAEALEILDPLGPSPELAMAMSLQSQLLMLKGEFEGAINWGRKAIAMARDLDLPEVEVHATNNVGTAEFAVGIETGHDRLRESLSRALELGLEDHAARAYVNIADQLAGFRRLDDAQAVVDEGITYCAARDLELQMPYLRSIRAMLNVYRGNWQAGMDEANDVLAMPKITSVHRFVALVPLSLAQLRLGTLATEQLEELRQLAIALDEAQRLAPYARIAVEAAWLAGRRIGKDSELVGLYHRAAERADRRDLAELAIWLQWTGTQVETAVSPRGPLAEALTDPAAAADQLDALGNPYDAAVLRMQCGEDGLRRALVTFTELGAAPAVALTTARLRELGAANIPRGPRRATKDNPHGLTTRQLEVLDLVGERLTNAEIAERLFLSERTVDHHVSAILTKLDVTTREAATRKLGHRAGRR